MKHVYILINLNKAIITKIIFLYYLFQIIYWDAKSIFMEHRFITPKDSFIRAIAICQQRVIDCRADEVIFLDINNYFNS